jgi:putative transposase
MPGGPDEPQGLSVLKPQGSPDRTTDADPGDRSSKSRYGDRKILALLKREGWKVGKYLVERTCREEGLTLRQRRKRRRRVAEHRRERFHPTAPNQVWSMDFVADQLADGRRFRSLAVLDIYTRECLAIESDQRLKDRDVVLVLNWIKVQRGVAKMLHCDQVLTYKSRILGIWDSAQGSPGWSWASEIDGLGQAASTV